MTTVSNPSRLPCTVGITWRSCGGCGELFPAGPGQTHCRDCAPETGQCEAAHPDDGSPCDGPRDAVRIVDQVDDQRSGCVHHAAVALASIEDARVYPGSVPGAALEAHRRAQLRTPFAFDPGDPWPAPANCAVRGGW